MKARSIGGVVASAALVLLTSVGHGSPAGAPEKVDIEKYVAALNDPDLKTKLVAHIRVEDYAMSSLPRLIEIEKMQPASAPQTKSLHMIIDRQQRREKAQQRKRETEDRTAAANRASALAAYEHVGHHNPAWDADAKALIDNFASYKPSLNLKEQVEKMKVIAERLRKENCDDPLVGYYIARTQTLIPNADPGVAELDLKKATDVIEASQYPAQRKCWANARYVQYELTSPAAKTQDWRADLERHTDRAFAEWPDTVTDAGVTDQNASELANVLLFDWRMCKSSALGQAGDRGEAIGKLVPPWVKAMPTSTYPLVFKGTACIDWAWDARGSGWANTVTEEGWKAMKARLDIAEKTLIEAWNLDPKDEHAAMMMLACELGQGNGRDVMELWFQRAMDANPDCVEACNKKLYYLEPKWFGTPMDMINFGHECRDSGNFYGRLPFVLAHAHDALVAYAPNPQQYYAVPEVWEDIQSVYQPHLTVHPEAVFDRSYFAYYACICGQWEIANAQFEILKDKPDLTAFRTKQVYDAMAAQARQMSHAKRKEGSEQKI